MISLILTREEHIFTYMHPANDFNRWTKNTCILANQILTNTFRHNLPNGRVCI